MVVKPRPHDIEAIVALRLKVVVVVDSFLQDCCWFETGEVGN